MKKIFSLLIILYISTPLFSQNRGVGIGTDSPASTLDIIATQTDGTTSEALIPPRLTGDQIALADSKYGADQNSVIVYVTEPVTSPTPKTKNITSSGYYSYDSNSEEWELIGASTEPWFSTTTSLGATSNTENIFQTGQVGFGITTPHESAQLEIYSSDKGISLPVLASADRNEISTPANGLLIYNETTKCFSYYNTSTSSWLSLCGDQGPAKADVVNCDSPGVGPQGVYTAGVPINYSNNTYTVIVNVTKIGSYELVAKTSNGYSFNKSGKFVATGFQTIVMEGQGKPVNAGTDSVTLFFNDEEITPSCTLPTITVRPSEPTITIYCPGITVNGEYLTGIDLNGTNYITIPITEVVTPGNFSFSFTSVNGYKFSYTGAINQSTTSITLTGTGAPWNQGTDTLNLEFSGGNIVGATTCSINIDVKLGLGGFNNPANRCLEIYTKTAGNSVDGEYWVKYKSADSSPVKTFCDMTNGGYTLLWSYSENTLYKGGGVYGPTNSMALNTANASLNNTAITAEQGTVKTENGVMDYTNYRLLNATMINVRSANPGNYKVRITNNPTDMKDDWGTNNYFNVSPSTTGYDYISGSGSTCTESNVPTTGKLFGYVYDGTTNTTTYNGTNTSGDICPYVNSGGYASHWDAGTRMASNSVVLTTIPGGDSFNPGYMNNLFGFFGEYEINHHFGKCVVSASNPTGDDYNFSTTYCSYSLLRPHSFNNGEGRYLQWFVK